MNLRGVLAIYKFEMARAKRTIWQSLAAPLITTALFLLVFGAAIGDRMGEIEGVNFGGFIVPGLVLLSVLQQSLSNASFGIYFPKFTGTIYEILSAPLSPVETVISYVGAAASKSVILALVTMAAAHLFVDYSIDRPFLMLLFLVLIAVGFCLWGFLIGLLANNFEQLQAAPLLIITPLTFLGGIFYSIATLPDPWRTLSLFNPIVYLVSGYRWTFNGVADVPIWSSWLAMGLTIAIPLTAIAWIFKTGHRLKQ
ncbi:ABC transporter permease [Sphingomicrobium sediminis]|uniref:Transport permease protein n=1 Tax=Sphingomicrobium sediminis TaxID=2950949 RepID=A0A9X2J1N8_9SPHN|nr:ABC transporter permease [Sphingomicrobium sediminis]MCM8556914.1 ABC transporter permease [Sphingomicrobium sediminis]